MKINLKNIPTHTWVSIVMIILVVTNNILASMGKSPIQFGEDQITMAVNAVIDMIAFGYVAWKNNSITGYAQLADKVLYALRDGKITEDEIMDLIAAIPKEETDRG